MSKVIRGGTVITADRTWKADVLVEGEKIAAIGENLTGDETVDATTHMSSLAASTRTRNKDWMHRPPRDVTPILLEGAPGRALGGAGGGLAAGRRN